MSKYSLFSLTASHCGVYRAETNNDKLHALHPFERDADPSPIAQGYIDTLEGELRIKSPMIRKSWLDNGPGSNTSDRGKDPFVEVDWETAERLVVAELNRVKTQFGNSAIYGGSYGWSGAGRFHHAQSQLHRFLNCIGGYTRSINSYSLAAGEVILKHIVGDGAGLIHRAPPWTSIVENTDLLVAFGGMPLRNAQISNGGTGQHRSKAALLEAKSSGVSFVNVSPIRNDVSEALKAQWISPRPGSDVAVMMGLAHEILTNGWHDKAFLNRYTHGFRQFEKYLTGQDDGVKKSIEWASEISGVPALTLSNLAKKMVKGRTLISVSWSMTRQEFGEQPFWMATTLAAMLGQIGLPGGGIAYGYCAANSVGAEKPHVAYASFPQMKNPVKDFIPVARIADMLLNPGEAYRYNGQSLTYPDIRLIYWAGGNPFHHHQDLSKLVKAWEKPETIIVHEWCWNATAKRADIVLPCTTSLEREDIMITPRDRFIVAMEQVVKPIADTRNDYDIFCALSQRLGESRKFSNEWTAAEWIRWIYEESRKKAETFNVDLPSYEDLKLTGWHEVSFPDSFEDAFSAFRQNPNKEPLQTASGKIEITSSMISEFGDEKISPHPVWQEPTEWLGAENDEYPFHLISSQPSDKLHSQLDHGSYSRSQKMSSRTPVDIHPADANHLGIQHGDIVRIYNSRGACLGAANFTTDMMQGVLRMSTGAWLDAIQQKDGTLLCLHGNPNTVTRDVGTSELAQGPTAHSCLVAIELYLDAPDVKAFEPPEILSN